MLCTTGFLRFMPSGDVCRLLGFSLGAMLGGLGPAYLHIAQGPRVTPTDDGLPPGASAHRSLGSVLSGQPANRVRLGFGPTPCVGSVYAGKAAMGVQGEGLLCTMQPEAHDCGLCLPGLTRRCSAPAEPSKLGPFWSLTCFWAVLAS